MTSKLILTACLTLLSASVYMFLLASPQPHDIEHIFFTQKADNLTLSASATIKPRAPSYDQDAYVKFFQFDKVPHKPNGDTQEGEYKNAVLTALVVIQDILNAALLGLGNQLDTTTLLNVYTVLTSINQNLGNPIYNGVPGCAVVYPPGVWVWYDDPPTSYYYKPGDLGCKDGQTFGYNFYAGGSFPNIHDGLVICELWFKTYRGRGQVAQVVDQLGPYINFGTKFEEAEPSFLSAQILLHELLHYRLLYVDVWTAPTELGQIIDLELEDTMKFPGRKDMAYGAWAATRILDPTFNILYGGQYQPALRDPMYNADNWLSMATEYYIKWHFKPSIVWQDPPDSRDGPHFPAGHPLANTVQPQRSVNDRLLGPEGSGS